jgi:transcriptional regulator with XRE-family HTH domain
MRWLLKMENSIVFAQNLKRALKENGIKQKDLAAEIGMDNRYLNKFLNGKQGIGFGYILKINELHQSVLIQALKGE